MTYDVAGDTYPAHGLAVDTSGKIYVLVGDTMLSYAPSGSPMM
jgi:hypothetical protein